MSKKSDAIAAAAVAEASDAPITRAEFDALALSVATLQDLVIPPPPIPPSDLDVFSNYPTGAEWPFAWGGDPEHRPSFLPRMKVADKNEATLRARWGYGWAGNQAKFGAGLVEAWQAVKAIKALTQADIEDHEKQDAFRFRHVNQAFACYGTLANLWPVTAAKAAAQLGSAVDPDKYAGYTIQTWLEEQIARAGGAPSGG